MIFYNELLLTCTDIKSEFVSFAYFMGEIVFKLFKKRFNFKVRHLYLFLIILLLMYLTDTEIIYMTSKWFQVFALLIIYMLEF